MKPTRCSRLIIRLIALSLGSAALCIALTQPQASELHHTVVSGDAITWGPARRPCRRAPRPPSCWEARQRRDHSCSASNSLPGSLSLRIATPRTSTSPSSPERSRLRPARRWIAQSLKPLPPASFVHLPAGMPHYAVVDVETIVQINGVGPFDVTYVDPKDDPRKR